MTLRRLVTVAILGALSVATGCVGDSDIRAERDVQLEEVVGVVPWHVGADVPRRHYTAITSPSDRHPIALHREVETQVPAGGAGLIGAPLALAIDESDNIYVSDQLRDEILQFDSDGRYVGSLGRLGPGPGEFSELGAIAIAGQRLVSTDTQTRRVSVWDLESRALVSDRAIWRARRIFGLDGMVEGDVVASYTNRAEDGNAYRHVFRMSQHGGEVHVYASLLISPRPEAQFVRDNGGVTHFYSLPIGTPEGGYAVSATGEVYLTRGNDYEVLALSGNGSARWTLSVSWPKEDVTQVEIDAAKDYLRDRDDPRLSEALIERVVFPQTNPALSRTFDNASNGKSLRVDGLGFLYVFPNIPLPWDTDQRQRPVDVYSPDGEFVFAGLIENVNWRVARDDYILALATDAADEWTAVRYRMEWPEEFRSTREAARRAASQ
jgi:hypothetical protein